MNRKQRVGMIVRVLLMPFTRPPFGSEDLLKTNAENYRKLRDHTDRHRKLSERCERSRERLITSITGEAQADRRSELRELIEMFYPEHELAQCLDENDEQLESYYFEVLLRLAEEMITLRDGRVSIKTWETYDAAWRPDGLDREFFPGSSGLYQVELWSEISRLITPDVLIAGYFVRCGIREPDYLRNLPANIFLGDKLFSRIIRNGLAETHLHLSAGMNYLSVWEAVTDPSAQRMKLGASSEYHKQQIYEQEEYQNLIIAGWLRLMLAKYLEERGQKTEREKECDRSRKSIFVYYDEKRRSGELPEDSLECAILKCILSETHEDQEAGIGRLREELSEKRRVSLSILRNTYGITDLPSSQPADLDILMRGPYRRYQRLHTAAEQLLLFFAMQYIGDEPSDGAFQRVFLCYLRIKNEYFRNKLQTTGMSGLSFFREYFRKAASALNVRKEDGQKRRLVSLGTFRNQLHCADLEKLEIKISPPVYDDRSVEVSECRHEIAKQLLELFRTYLSAMKEVDRQSRRIPTLGVVYHMIRQNMYDSPSDMCWLVKTAGTPGDTVSCLRRQCEAFVEALQQLLREVPNLSEYVVGLDVASEELHAEPWIYAPVYRKARNRYNTYPVQPDTGYPMQNLGFTYHVGEDYHHVISGLRHIDEVLTHFGYKAGDRLGHATSLHVDMAEWLHSNEITSIPTIEHFENLLWLWSLCSEDAGRLGEYLPGLEKEIMSLASELYYNIKGLSPYVFWRAYYKKFSVLSPDFCEKMERLYLDSEDSGAGFLQSEEPPDAQRSFCARVRYTGGQACGLHSGDNVWDTEKLLLTYYCPMYERHYRRPRFVSNGVDKLPFFQAVQSYMREKVQNMGVYVEINPTSNLMIGDISGLTNYKILDLNDRIISEQPTSSILLSVNSDDPLVFNTNIENELALVYYMLIYQGVSRERAMEWIDKVRQYGIDSSFIQTVKSRSRQRRELEAICDRLEALCGGI